MIEKHPLTDETGPLHPLRHKHLTASDIGAVLGVDPYRSALRVYAEKAGEINATEETNIMRRGRWLESAAFVALQEALPGWPLIRPNVYVCDPVLRLGCTPDALGEDPEEPGLVNFQIKTVSRPTFERDWIDEPPLGYQLQTACENLLVDARTGYLVAFVIDTYSAELELFEVPRHAGAEEIIRATAPLFWQTLEAGKRPAPDYDNDRAVIDALHPRAITGLAIDLSTDNLLPGLLDERAQLKARIAESEGRIEHIDAEVKNKLGDAESALLPGWKITWRNQDRKAYSVPATSSRRLNITKAA